MHEESRGVAELLVGEDAGQGERGEGGAGIRGGSGRGGSGGGARQERGGEVEGVDCGGAHGGRLGRIGSYLLRVGWRGRGLRRVIAPEALGKANAQRADEELIGMRRVVDGDGGVHLGDTGGGRRVGGAEGDEAMSVAVGHVLAARAVDGNASHVTATGGLTGRYEGGNLVSLGDAPIDEIDRDDGASVLRGEADGSAGAVEC
mmetsp:Transcript_7922/g.26013  ORF Transcript_7922/g.26013 Transcript_7922/m.26013 type:complete len:203 (-) Transcript_7922:850-1458(-)